VIASADIVVVGSGAFGASAAYHLARRGARLAVLERSRLASQTSPRAARGSPPLSTLPLTRAGAARAPQPHPSTRLLPASPGRRRTARGQSAITVPTLAFAPVKRAVPVSGWGVRRGRPHVAHPGRTVREGTNRVQR